MELPKHLNLRNTVAANRWGILIKFFPEARIEGDNLQVLKLLQKGDQGKAKMIYLDPPDNTGKDFIYPDNNTEDLHAHLQYCGQVEAEGRKWGSNTESRLSSTHTALTTYDMHCGMQLVCLAQPLTYEALNAMAARKPQRAVCLDAGFSDNDQMKANAVQLLKGKGVVFKTV